MTHVPRRTLEEVLVRYRLEPHLKDVFVEGPFDCEVLGAALPMELRDSISFYCIDSVDLPRELLLGDGLSSGNKQRVLYLARRLAAAAGSSNVRCVADRDLDHWFGDLEVSSHLRWTDWTALELYFYTDELLDALLFRAGRIKVESPEALISSVSAILRELYSYRLADRELSTKLMWAPFERCLSMEQSAIILDSRAYLRKVLQASNAWQYHADFTAKAAEWQSRLTSDVRGEAHGHDMVALLAWCIRSLNGAKALGTAEALERTLVLLAPRISTLATLTST